MKRTTHPQSGFTIVEVLVAIAIFAVAIISIATLAGSLQQAHRNNQYLGTAMTAAKDIVELARSTEYGDLKYGTTTDKTSYLNENGIKLPGGTASMTTNYVEGTYGLKRIDVTISYVIGSDTRSVQLSSFIGLWGTSQ